METNVKVPIPEIDDPVFLAQLDAVEAGIVNVKDRIRFLKNEVRDIKDLLAAGDVRDLEFVQSLIATSPSGPKKDHLLELHGRIQERIAEYARERKKQRMTVS